MSFPEPYAPYSINCSGLGLFGLPGYTTYPVANLKNQTLGLRADQPETKPSLALTSGRKTEALQTTF
jgi:hypothetical protein